MEELLSIVVLILYFVITGAAWKNKKNKNNKKEKRRTSRSRDVQFEQAFERVSSSHKRLAKENVVGASVRETEQITLRMSEEGSDPCHESILPPQKENMRFECVSQTQLSEAQEGEDPCHMGTTDEQFASPEESPVYRSPIFDTEDKDAFAQDVLRGIVMNEVLSRPATRRMGRGMKRGA